MIISIILSYYTWNKKIYFDDEKIFYKEKGQKYIWKWSEIADCKIISRFSDIRNPLSVYFEIGAENNDKKLTFEYSCRREKFLLEICPLEKTKKIFEESFNKQSVFSP